MNGLEWLWLFRQASGSTMNSNQCEIEPNPKRGEKMIELRVRLWTDEIAEVDGAIVKKHCWDYGTVSMLQNDSHGIEPQGDTHFHSIMDLTGVVAEVLARHGVRMHVGPKSAKTLEG